MIFAEQLQTMNRRYGARLERVPKEVWPPMRALQPERMPIEVWRSRTHMVMVYRQDGHERLSVLRTELALNGRYAEGISWDDLQRLKAECGRADCWACELYPPTADVVNIQNMRHLFVLPEPPAFGWRSGEGTHGA